MRNFTKQEHLNSIDSNDIGDGIDDFMDPDLTRLLASSVSWTTSVPTILY